MVRALRAGVNGFDVITERHTGCPTNSDGLRPMNLPTLPMGSLMAALMLIGAAALAMLAPRRRHHGPARAARTAIGALAALGAGWQLAWYAVRHPGTFWGVMATLSGLALAAAALLLLPREVTGRFERARWPSALVLLGLGIFYAASIVRL